MAGKQQVTVSFIADTRAMRKGIDQVNGQLNTFQNTMKGFAAITAAAFVAQPIIDWAKQGIMAASDFEEALNKSNVVFGSNASAVEKWSDNSVTAMGLTSGAALEAAGTFGNLLTAFGATQEQAAGMSTQMVQLASDLASFNNTSIDDAINAIRSGLSGEMEPLKKFGITLSDVRLRAEGAAQGLDTTGKSLDPLTKSFSAYNLILKDSTNAQGDFVRTSDGFANQLKILEAGTKELQRAFGKGFLDALGNAGDAFGGLSSTMEDLQPVMEYFGKDLGTNVKFVADFVNWLTKMTKAIQTVTDKFELLNNGLWDFAQRLPLPGNQLKTLQNIFYSLTGGINTAGDSVETTTQHFDFMADAADRAAKKVTGLTMATSNNIFANATLTGSAANFGKLTGNAFLLAYDYGVDWDEVGDRTGTKLGSGTSSGFERTTKKALKDWAANFADIDVEVTTKLGKASETLANGYSTRLDALKAAAKAYQQAVSDSIATVNKQVEEYSSGLSEAFLGYNLSDFIKEIKDDSGNVTGTVFDSEAFQKWLGDKEAIRSSLSPLLNQIPQLWAEQIIGMDNSSAKATIDWLTTSPDQVSNLQTTFTQLSSDVKATLSDPLAEAMRGTYWAAQMEGIEAAKAAVDKEAASFKKFVSNKLKTKIVIDIEYREINSPPAAAARSTVAAVQSFEALNGRSWRS